MRDVSRVHGAQRPNTTSRSQIVVVAAGLLWACLPAGGPPAGQHVVHDRRLSGVYFTASEVDGVPSRVLATGALRQPPDRCQLQIADLLADVFQFPVLDGQRAVSLSDQQPIIKDFILEGGDVAKYSFATDRRGRPLYLACFTKAGFAATWRYDWTSASASYLGDASGGKDGKPYTLSPGRTRVFGNGLFELDGHGTSLAGVDKSQYAFVGEDFYYVSMSSVVDMDHTRLGRSKPGVAPELLLSSTGRIGLASIQGDQTPRIAVCLYANSLPFWASACGAGYVPFALFDPQRLTTSVLPFHPVELTLISASGDGHWLLFSFLDSRGGTGPADKLELLLFDWTTGAIAKTSSPFFSDLPINGAGEWRPGRQELWFYFSGTDTYYGIWDPTWGFRLMAGTPVRLTELPDRRISMFTRDGAFWFSWQNGKRTAHIGPADSPGAPPFPLHPDGTVMTALWEIGDGRLIVGSSTTDPNRWDIAVIDPVARTSRTIASGGHLVAVGHDRALAILDWETSRSAGNLALVNLADGGQTLLAENVYAAAVDPGTTADVPAEADQLAAGTRVAFLTRSRLESPYDGLWVARLP